MPSATPLDYQPSPEALIDALLERIAANPCDVELHRELREVALRRKGNGGPPLRSSWRLRAASDPVQELIRAERVMAFDPGNTDLLKKVIQAVETCAAAQTASDFDPLRFWLLEIVERALRRRVD